MAKKDDLEFIHNPKQIDIIKLVKHDKPKIKDILKGVKLIILPNSKDKK